MLDRQAENRVARELEGRPETTAQTARVSLPLPRHASKRCLLTVHRDPVRWHIVFSVVMPHGHSILTDDIRTNDAMPCGVPMAALPHESS